MGSRAGKCLRRTGEGPPIRGVHIKSQHEGKAHLKQAAPQGATGKAEWGARCRGPAGRDGPTHSRGWQREDHVPRRELRLERAQKSRRPRSGVWGRAMGRACPLHPRHCARDQPLLHLHPRDCKATFRLPPSGGGEPEVSSGI